MRRILSIVFLFALTLDCFGQSDYDPKIERLLAISDKETFPAFWSEFEPFKDSFTNELLAGQLRLFGNHNKFRSYGFGFSEYILEIRNILEVNEPYFSEEKYRLTILFDDIDSSIVYNRLIGYRNYGQDEYETTAELKYDSIKLEMYFARHDSLYRSETIRNYRYPPFISKKYYGPLCPNHGSTQHDEMLRAVENNRNDILLDWIRSFNIEDKAYGAAGLYFLKKKGVMLSEEEELLIGITQRLEADVQTDLRISYLLTVLYDGVLDRRFERYFKE